MWRVVQVVDCSLNRDRKEPGGVHAYSANTTIRSRGHRGWKADRQKIREEKVLVPGANPRKPFDIPEDARESS
jgi:hypothetical protein